jgi:SHAQKYF class myb-like DNA-binding protein
MACNEMLKSQLQENELRIKHCQERAKTGSCDNDSHDGTDDDSTNGASSVSNASTTPCTSAKEPAAAKQSRYWTEEEHGKFLEAVRCFGAHNHKAIASYVTTRNSTQVRSHSQKFLKKLETFRGSGLPSMLRKRKTAEST